MASELDVAHGGIRPPSPFPDAVVQHLRLEDPASLRKYLVKLHCLLNMTVPINQLPTELFAEILRFVRLQHPRHWSFVTVLLVCHHWYDIAVSLPMLWSDVTIAMPLHILEMYLTRSGDVSLSIAMQGQRTPASASPASLLNALSPHSHRVAQLDTCSSYPWIEHRMERISSLTIDDCDDMLWTFFASIPPPNGAISIHGDRFPNLESLTLCEVRVPASIASLRSLTSLKLDYVPYASWNALLDALGSCPALECLVLDSPIAPFESIVPPIHAGQNIVELRHLRRLDLSNFDLDDVDFEYPSLSFLLAHLSLPRTVRIDISTDFGEYDEQDSNELSTLLAGIIPADKTALPVFSALQGVQVTIGSQHLELVASGRDEAQTSGPSSFTLSHAMHGRWNKGYLQEQIVNELPMVFPSSVLTLRILVQGEDDNYDTFGNNWSRLYSAFPHIEDLCLGGPDPLFFNFLRDIGPDTPSQHEPLPWPKLKSIRFEFTATEDGVPFPGSAAESEQVVRAITSSMCNRRDATSVERLQHLTLVFPQKEFWPMEIAKLQSTTQTLVVLHD